jgi:tRNA-specific 2-thiouridylase
MKLEPKKVFVGVSGGVDSSVAAALLKDQGHDVVGVFIRTWQPDWIECTWKDERRDAMRVCSQLDIPFIELDLEDEYKRGVADYMISEYQKGRTPNPDVMCNREVKFGGFLSWALQQGADFVATGHYVQRSEGRGKVQMLRGNDTGKDQSYFLWTLTQKQLQHILFPVGSLEKKEVRALAEKYQLPTATKRDSQGICFIGEIDMKEFLKHYIDVHPGDILNEEGQVIGHHEGALFYTIGERHGLELFPQHKGSNDAPYYVKSKDVENNTLTVSHDVMKTNPTETQAITLIDVVDNQGVLQEGATYQAQVRYHGEVKELKVVSYDVNQSQLVVELAEADMTVAPGQSIVLYDNNLCLGGGVIA